MKLQWLVCSMVVLWSASAPAQNRTPSTVKTPVLLSIEPAAQTLLDRAAPNYHDSSGIRFTVARSFYKEGIKKEPRFYLTQYARPDKISISRQTGRGVPHTDVVSDGSHLYIVIGQEFKTLPSSPQSASAMMSSDSTSGKLIAAMLGGTHPISGDHSVTSGTFKCSRVVALPPRIVDGEVLQGIRYTLSADEAVAEKYLKIFPEMRFYREEVTAWFGGTPFLLRRVQSRIFLQDSVTTVSEKVLDQQLSPTFDPGIFQFDDIGLKPESTKPVGSNQPYWDPRLKVGTLPFAFSGQDLQGRPLSLEKYRGKVLLLDFWATWCGPCVESIPRLKSAYDKYHAQGLEVIGISSDQDKKALTSFIKARKMPWPQIFDTENGKSQISDIYGVKGIPFMLLIGRNGRIAAVDPLDNIDAAVKSALAQVR